MQLPAGLLLGEALYAQGSSNPASLVEALAVYDNLLAHAKDQPALFNRLQYLRGTTLEQLPDEKDPTKKREKQAFQAYHSVLETTTAAGRSGNISSAAASARSPFSKKPNAGRPPSALLKKSPRSKVPAPRRPPAEPACST